MEDLKRIGLTEYEAKVYLTLIKLKSATGGQIAKDSKVPHGKTYESLISLSDKGLITIIPVEPKLFKLIEPKRGLENLVNIKANGLRETGKNILSEIEKIKSFPKEEAFKKLEVYSGVKKQFELATEMIASARKQILIVSRGEKVPNSILQATKRFTGKGGDFRIIVYEIEGNSEWLRKFKEVGMKLRYLKTGEFTIIVKDREEVLLVIKNPKNLEDRTVTRFKDKAIAEAMAVYFETIWREASEIKI